MNVRGLVVGFTAVSLLGAAVVASPVAAAAPSATPPSAAPAANSGPATVSDPVSPVLSPALRDIPVSPRPREGGEVPEGRLGPDTSPGRDLPNSDNETGPVQRDIAGEAPADLVPVNSFAGGTTDSYAGQSTPFFPPDTVGDVGPNHYVQMVNVTFQIWNKQGTSLAGPTNIKALWSGFPAGTPCRETNDGDPIVLYDQAADRWMLAQFSVRGTGYQMCIAYSTTPDPTGTYWTYAFDMPDFPDYEKFGIWPDGLYMSTYETGLGAYVFDRAAMLTGSAATFQRFVISAGGGPREQRILPADWDGVTAPPAGAPNPFLMSVDAQVQGGAVDRLELYNFHVDWATPGNSTFTLDQTLPTDPFSVDIGSNCMGNVPASFRACVPQPGTTNKVDDLSNRLMWRLQYRNFGDHQALVTNQTVNSGNNTAALRWYELRSTGTNWSIHQQNTFAPADTAYRWMGSAAMDGVGNIALGYSISDATALFPSINYTGQRVGAPVNQLSEPETRMFTGIASQTSTGRWGDYSAMSVDPVDECTFWYTQMHIGAEGTRQTRIGTAKFTSCAQPKAELKLVKKTDPSSVSADLWTLKAEAAAPLEGKNLSTPGGQGSFTSVYAGTAYALSETGGPAGYAASGWVCKKDGASTQYPGQNGAAVTLTAGDKVSCEITNTRDTAQLSLEKKVSGGDKNPVDWTLKAEAAAPLDNKNISRDGDITTPATVYSGVDYSLSEVGKAGTGDYSPGTWSCKTVPGGASVPVATGDKINLTSGANVACEITNTRDTAQLSLEKKVSGGDKNPVDWTLKAEAAAPLDNKNISRDGDITTPATVYSGVDYSLSEVGKAGTGDYSPGTWSCKTVPGGASVPVATGDKINLTSGANVACEITNTRDTAQLSLEKKVSGGDKNPVDWTLKAEAAAPLDNKNISRDGDITTPATVYSGVDYSLSEVGKAGTGDYSPGTWSCKTVPGGASVPVATGDKINLTSGANVACEITNTRDTAELKLVKQVAGGSAKADDWTLTAKADAPLNSKNISTPGGSGTFQSVYGGTDYTLAETGPGNYTASTWVCVTEDQNGDAQTNVAQQGDTVKLDKGERATCTITNDRDLAQLKLVKQVEGGSAKPDDWTLTAKAAPPEDDKNISTPGGSGKFERVYAGSEYTLDETGPGGYSPSDWVCLPDTQEPGTRPPSEGQLNAGDKITLGKGQRVTCTIVNTRDRGSLTITKDFNPQASGYSGTFDINYSCVDGADLVKNGTVTLSAGKSETIPDLPTGTVCTVTEPTMPANPTGWTFNPPSFSPANGQATINTKNQSVSVTVVNSVAQAGPAGVKRTCPIDVRLHKPAPKKVGNRIVTDKIKTKESSCVLLKPVVLCRPIPSTATGEKTFCDTKVTKKGRITVKTKGYEAVRVTVIVRAKPKPGFSDGWKPNTWRKSWKMK